MEPASSHLPQVAGGLLVQREHTMPKAASKLAAAPSTPPASISKTPVAEHSSLFRRLLQGKSTEATVTVPDYGGPRNRESRGNCC